MSASSQVPVAGATILKNISPQSGIPDKQFGPPMSGMLIPFGPKGDIAKLPFGAFDGWAASMIKGKKFFTDNFATLYHYN